MEGHPLLRGRELQGVHFDLVEIKLSPNFLDTIELHAPNLLLNRVLPSGESLMEFSIAFATPQQIQNAGAHGL